MEKQNFETKWNWGAFVDTLGFSIGNRAYLGLLTLIPVFGLVWVFITGFKGEQWALENKENSYRDEEEFRKVMDSWKRAGFVQFIIYIALFVLYFILFYFFIGMALSTFGSLN